MRVFIAGIEGYLGFALCNHMMARGDTVGGLDAGHRDRWVRETGSQSAIPIAPWSQRHAALKEAHGEEAVFYPADMRNYGDLVHILRSFQPDVVVHLAEQPSAPFSLIDAAHSALTQECNIVGSLNLLWAVRDVCPAAHILKLGTMGEFGTPGIRIPEGVFPEDSLWSDAPGGPPEDQSGSDSEIVWPHTVGSLAGKQFPRQPGSFYHASKVADSVNTEMACRFWGLRSTDVMQGVVYGTRIDAMGGESLDGEVTYKCWDPRLRTRFDFDAIFGTAINRFCAQAVAGRPITPYGKGGQKRGFLPLRDSMQCLTLLMDNPPAVGDYRVVNQLEEVYEINALANLVAAKADDLGIVEPVGGRIRNVDNPRLEQEEHTYEVDHNILADLGYKPASTMDAELEEILTDLIGERQRIIDCVDAITPSVRWAK
jgi:UDP-sulfoquinovose synthase